MPTGEVLDKQKQELNPPPRYELCVAISTGASKGTRTVMGFAQRDISHLTRRTIMFGKLWNTLTGIFTVSSDTTDLATGATSVMGATGRALKLASEQLEPTIQAVTVLKTKKALQNILSDSGIDMDALTAEIANQAKLLEVK